MEKKAKIIATIGPASNSSEIIEQLIREGMDCARLNFSHGTHEEHERTYRTIRACSQKLGRPIAILQDLQGPKIRVGRFKEGRVTLKEGDLFTLTSEEVDGDSTRATISYPTLYQDVKVGDQLLLDDGLLVLRVLKVVGLDIVCEVQIGGVLSDHKGVNLPNTPLNIKSLTDKDLVDLQFGIGLKVDYIALSFVRKPQNILDLKEILKRNQADIPVIAKLEKPEAIANLKEIIEVADGVMVARGDLGVELPPEQVPIIQKRIIREADSQGKLDIVATQMLDSMTHNIRPTRAEASDVANAILDGADILMLSGETACGKYPVQVMSMMHKIISEVEGSPLYQSLPKPEYLFPIRENYNAICAAAVTSARHLDVRTIVVFTLTGRTARIISMYRPKQKIVAVSPYLETVHRMALYWGVEPLLLDKFCSTDEMVTLVSHLLIERGLSTPGETVVITLSAPALSAKETNLLKIHQIKA